MGQPHECKYAEYNDGHVYCGVTDGGGADNGPWTCLCQLCSKDQEITRLREDKRNGDVTGMKRAFQKMAQGHADEVTASWQLVVDTPGLISVWIGQERVAVFDAARGEGEEG